MTLREEFATRNFSEYQANKKRSVGEGSAHLALAEGTREQLMYRIELTVRHRNRHLRTMVRLLPVATLVVPPSSRVQLRHIVFLTFSMPLQVTGGSAIYSSGACGSPFSVEACRSVDIDSREANGAHQSQNSCGEFTFIGYYTRTMTLDANMSSFSTGSAFCP